MECTAAFVQRCVEIAQALAEELVVLAGGIRFGPERGFDHVEAQHRTPGRGLAQGGVVMDAEIALEPDDGVAHG